MKEAKKSKNIIFLKDVESNLIEEAIVILNKKVNLENLNKKSKYLNSEMVLKEAKNVINNYSKKIEVNAEIEKIKIKNKRIKIVNIILIITNLIFIVI